MTHSSTRREAKIQKSRKMEQTGRCWYQARTNCIIQAWLASNYVLVGQALSQLVFRILSWKLDTSYLRANEGITNCTFFFFSWTRHISEQSEHSFSPQLTYIYIYMVQLAIPSFCPWVGRVKSSAQNSKKTTENRRFWGSHRNILILYRGSFSLHISWWRSNGGRIRRW